MMSPDPAQVQKTTFSDDCLHFVEMPANVRGLFSHIVDGGGIKQRYNFGAGVLHIFSRDILKLIKEEEPSWVSMAPAEIAEVIKRRRFFGYREAETPHLAGLISQ
jgi:hypothetical protein